MVEYSFYDMHGSSSTPGSQAAGTKNIISAPPKAAAKIRLWTLSPTFSWPTLHRMTAAARANFRPLAARVHAPWPLEHARWGKSAASARLSPTFRRRPRCRFRRPWRYSCRLVMARQIVSRRRGVVNEGFSPRCRPENRASMLATAWCRVPTRRPARHVRPRRRCAPFSRGKNHTSTLRRSILEITARLPVYRGGYIGTTGKTSRCRSRGAGADGVCGGGWVPAREMESGLKEENG